jgi:hypothetical protein
MIKLQDMTGVVIKVNVGSSSPSVVVTGADGREYILGDFGDYIDLDQSLRPPPFSPQEIDVFTGEPWMNQKVEFEYAEAKNGKLLIIQFFNLRLPPRE